MKTERQEAYDAAKAVIDAFGTEWRPDHGRIRTSKNTLGYWDDWDQMRTIHNLPYPPYVDRRKPFKHVYSASPALIIELMDEIDALKAQIENLGGISLAKVKTNEA